MAVAADEIVIKYFQMDERNCTLGFVPLVCD